MISGNVGLNCHLSELISKIVEPLTTTTDGFDIDSTQNMLHLISKFNAQENKDLTINRDCINVSTEEERRKKFRSKEGEWFVKTDDEHRKTVLNKIEKLRNFTKEGEVLPDLTSQLEATRLLEIVEKGEKFSIPEPAQVDKET